MTKRWNFPLWALELVLWIVATAVVANVLPAEPGPYSERPGAKALLIGGVVALSSMIIDLVRHPRRLWLWGLVAWASLFCYGLITAILGTDSDIDQLMGWAFLGGGLVGLPLIVASIAIWTGKTVRGWIERRPRRWSLALKPDGLEIVRRSRGRRV